MYLVLKLVYNYGGWESRLTAVFWCLRVEQPHVNWGCQVLCRQWSRSRCGQRSLEKNSCGLGAETSWLPSWAATEHLCLCHFPNQMVHGREIIQQWLNCVVSTLSILIRSEEIQQSYWCVRNIAFLENFTVLVRWTVCYTSLLAC